MRLPIADCPLPIARRAGQRTVADGNKAVADGNITVTDGNMTVADGNMTVADGNMTVADGNITVADGNITVADGNITVLGREKPVCLGKIRKSSQKPAFCAGFSLVEVLIVVTLLSFIVLALMAVFSSTQRAFRASVTQTDVLEGGRATMELVATDLRGMVPSGTTNDWPVNFCVYANTGYTPLVQTLPPGSSARTNVLNYFFVLGRDNNKWTGTGYFVDTANSTNLYSLYRFYAETNINASPSPRPLYDAFTAAPLSSMSHLLDGVVHLTVRAYGTNGTWLQNSTYPYFTNAQNTVFIAYGPDGEAQFKMLSNTVPAAVEIEIGVLEDRVREHAEALPTYQLRTNYLSDKSGAVHLFRQRVAVPNVDPTAYQ